MSDVIAAVLPQVALRGAVGTELRARGGAGPAHGGRRRLGRCRVVARGGAAASSRRRASGSTPTHDVVGVELGGALKNVIAIAAGHRSTAWDSATTRARRCITRGLAEITRLGVAHGRRPAHLRRPRRHGRPGAHRDRRSEPQPALGVALGEGEPFESYRARAPHAWPKARTPRAPATASRKQLGVELPITAAGLRRCCSRRSRRRAPSAS